MLKPSPVNQTATTAAAPFSIVAIGASAGGFEALEQFFSHVPANSGIAYVVIQHLDPDHKGILPELLQRSTTMPVTQARNRLKVKPDTVYVIPPNRDLSILRGALHLLDPVAPRGLRLPIDFFLRTLADDWGERAIGVILSGMGSDGTLGLRAIKEHGGLVLVQEPASAKFDSMPRSAINTGLVDIIAQAAELPASISGFVSHAPSSLAGLYALDVETSAQKSGLEKICNLLRMRTSHDFSHYKKNTLYRRIERRMVIHQLGRIDDYVRYLRETPLEIDQLFKELLIGVTRFFRDSASWNALRDSVFTDLLLAHPSGAALRAWVAGCSTGEEAYSLAIVFREALERVQPNGHCALQIFATDLDPDAIATARMAHYPANIAADVSAERLERYFFEEGNGYGVGKEIREMVVFAPHNVLSDPPFTRLDILTCRNLLIYLDADLQKKLLPLFRYSLKPGGTLMLGSSESIGNFTKLFSPLDAKARLYQRDSSLLPLPEIDFPARYSVNVNRMEPSMNAKPMPIPPNLQTLAEQILLQRFAPASVLVDATGDVLFVSGRTGKYLELADGKANWNIHAMAREGLRHELALALPKALRNGESVSYRNLKVAANGGSHVFDLSVHPLTEPAAVRGMVMLVFSDVAPGTRVAVTAEDKGHARPSRRVTELEQVVTEARQDQQALREEMQTSQEELKSTNEELQSTNEELQSTNEELTTSKEEMQSLNEELHTVNIELQSKVDELSAANSDMKNLLNSTDIATVFLDNALRVRRFTTQATQLFKLIPGDIGRPLSDLVSDLDYADFSEDAERVLQTLVYSEREVATGDGRWFQVKIMPYRTMNNVIDGIVITFNDIGRAKRLEEELRHLATRKMDAA